MNTNKQISEVEKHIRECYLQTNWAFFSFIQLKNQFGESCLSDLKQMKKDGKIQLRGYINGHLIEVINFEKWDK